MTGAESFGIGGGGGGGFTLADQPDIPGETVGRDYSIFTGDTPTETPSPLPDETIKPGPSAPTLPSGIMDKVLKYGPLALGAAGMLSQRAAAKRYPKELANIGAPQREVANQMIADAQAGRINPADAYAIDQWEKSAVAQSRDYFAKAGISDSTMSTGAENDIHARAAAMREQARTTLLQQGIDTLNVVDKYTVAAVQAEMAGDQATAKQATDFLSSYGAWLRAYPTLTGQPGTGTTPATPPKG